MMAPVAISEQRCAGTLAVQVDCSSGLKELRMITIKRIAKTAFGVALFALGCSSQTGDPQKE